MQISYDTRDDNNFYIDNPRSKAGLEAQAPALFGVRNENDGVNLNLRIGSEELMNGPQGQLYLGKNAQALAQCNAQELSKSPQSMKHVERRQIENGTPAPARPILENETIPNDIEANNYQNLTKGPQDNLLTKETLAECEAHAQTQAGSRSKATNETTGGEGGVGTDVGGVVGDVEEMTKGNNNYNAQTIQITYHIHHHHHHHHHQLPGDGMDTRRGDTSRRPGQ